MNRKNEQKILLVEDVKSIANFIRRRIEARLQLETICVATFAETRAVLEEESDFFVALLDLNLPDAPDGEVVDYVIAKKIPAIILTATFDEKSRESILNKNVVDYLIKDGLKSLEQITHLISRIHRNQFIKILVVDDSRAFRSYYRTLLANQRYHVVEAGNGYEALEMMEKNPDVRLVITDYNMPEMDGFELVSCLRKKFDKNEVAIIGISAQGSGLLSARFLKSGANDFLTKPFEKEEFYARVNQNIDILEYISELKDVATRDPLTKLFNRRYYFETGGRIFRECREKNLPLTIGMVDIDFFKKINDTHGHDAGDAVLKYMASLLEERVEKNDIVARFGGEEFCIMAQGGTREDAIAMFETIRESVESSAIVYRDKTIRVTISIGTCSCPKESLEEMINHADEMLYRAKNQGRNRLVSG